MGAVTRVAIASSSQLAAEAGARVAEQGGNAVDAAVAAVLASAVTDPGLVSLAASGALTVWAEGSEPITIQGAPAMPGAGQSGNRLGTGMVDVTMRYGKGWPTRVGYGSVAVYGLVRACAEAVERLGNLPWATIVAPARAYAEEGFPFSPGSNQFLLDTYEGTFSWNPQGIADLCDDSGVLLPAGEHVRIGELDASLRTLADEGPQAMYEGSLGARIARHVSDHGGLLTHRDLADYRAESADCLQSRLGPWRVATYGAPSVGGAVLSAILSMMAEHCGDPMRLVQAQRSALAYRERRLDLADDIESAIAELLAAASDSAAWSALRAPSTVHTSAVDDDDTGCAVTASIGYGSGVVVPKTGIWLANPLGEVELTRAGLERWPIGARLSTNMAPTVARRDDGAVLVIGSPGADRITTAIAQTLLRFVGGGTSLVDAVAHPRLHVELAADEQRWRVAHEPGIALDPGVRTRPFDTADLFFGGVAATLFVPGTDGGAFEVAGDPRRSCGTAVAGR